MTGPARPGHAAAPLVPGQHRGSDLQRSHALRGPADDVEDVLREPGRPLDTAVRDDMERRFATDFSRVRVHTDTAAAASAARLGAHAYTLGQDIVFGAGNYQPRTAPGRALLAHELTHTVQQAGVRPAAPGGVTVGASDDGFERAASAAGEAVLTGHGPLGRTDAVRVATPRIQRAGFWESIGSFFSGIGEGIARAFGGGTFTDSELSAYLRILATTGRIEDGIDSDNKAREVVRRRAAGRAPYTDITAVTRALLIQEMVSGVLSGEDQGAILTLLTEMTGDERTLVFTQTGDRLFTGFTGGNLVRLHRLLRGAPADQVLVRLLARSLREAFRGLGTDEQAVYEVLSYPDSTVREVINYYNDNLNDHTGRGVVEDVRDEMSDAELAAAERLLAAAHVFDPAYTVEHTTAIGSEVAGDTDRVWAGLIVRGKESADHAPGVMDQHADVVIPDRDGNMVTRGYFGDQPGTHGSSAGSRASIGMDIPGVSADMAWFLVNRRAYVDLELAQLVDMKSSLILVKVTRAQARILTGYWRRLERDPGAFFFLGRNCSTAAAAGFTEATVQGEITGLDTPDNLYGQIRARYPDAYMISGYYGYRRAGLQWQLAAGGPRLVDPGTGPWLGPYIVERRLR